MMEVFGLPALEWAVVLNVVVIANAAVVRRLYSRYDHVANTMALVALGLVIVLDIALLFEVVLNG